MVGEQFRCIFKILSLSLTMFINNSEMFMGFSLNGACPTPPSPPPAVRDLRLWRRRKNEEFRGPPWPPRLAATLWPQSRCAWSSMLRIGGSSFGAFASALRSRHDLCTDLSSCRWVVASFGRRDYHSPRSCRRRDIGLICMLTLQGGEEQNRYCTDHALLFRYLFSSR